MSTLDNRLSKEELDKKLKETADVSHEAAPPEEQDEEEDKDEEVAKDTSGEENEEGDADDGEEGEQDKGEDEEEDKDGKKKTVKQTPKEKEEIDWKAKHAASTREAQVLAAKSRSLEEKIEEANNLPEPTDDEMKHEYSDWDMLSEFEKKVAKESALNKKRFALINEANKEAKKIDEWGKKVDEFTTDPAVIQRFPRLSGREDEFRSFATRPTRRGVPLDDLVGAFLWEQKSEMDKRPPAHDLFPGGRGKAEVTDTNKGYTPEQVAQIRTGDPKLYRRLVNERKIKLDF